jgi:hypothetical protein
VRDPAVAVNASGGVTLVHVESSRAQIINMLYVDFVEYARVCDCALDRLGVP